MKHQPQTVEGFEAWEVVERCAGHLKLFPSGNIAGFDLPVALSITSALGYNEKAVLFLMEYAESGLREAIKKNDSNSKYLDQNSSN